MIRCTKGTVRYRIHTKNGKWLGWITQYNKNDAINGYAGIFGQAIDAIQVEIIQYILTNIFKNTRQNTTNKI